MKTLGNRKILGRAILFIFGDGARGCSGCNVLGIPAGQQQCVLHRH